ncbi:MAG: NUDIX hydrolase [Rhabdochlamydiaceae bacterium]|nr:NUDIX hydrolase [Candidatus Amphrikana amoebophyrae]
MKRRYIFTLATFLLTSSFTLQAEDYFQRYENLFQTYPQALGKLGDWKKGEIQILTDRDEIEKAERFIYKLNIAKGYSKEASLEFSKVGIIAEDTYFIFIRDAVMFPSGKYGTYDRIMPKHALNGPAGVAILATLPDNKIVTILNFRHATRTWCIELPRGSREVDESPITAAKRELNEETGYITDKVHLLGHLVPDSGILASKYPIYHVKAKMQIEPNHNYSEAISKVMLFTKDELKQALAEGFIQMDIQGKSRNVLVMDANISHALLLAEAQGIL